LGRREPDPHPRRGAWRFANVTLDEPKYDDRLVGSGQIVWKIREFEAILKDQSRPVPVRRKALRFLIHLGSSGVSGRWVRRRASDPTIEAEENLATLV
jgi:hypothetical protein